jgi:hypothetical protein
MTLSKLLRQRSQGTPYMFCSVEGAEFFAQENCNLSSRTQKACLKQKGADWEEKNWKKEPREER